MVEWVDVLLGDAFESADEAWSGIEVLDSEWRKRDHCGPLREAAAAEVAFRDMESGARRFVAYGDGQVARVGEDGMASRCCSSHCCPIVVP